MITDKAEHFDHWIRNEFRLLNTKLEEQYFAADDRIDVAQIGNAEKNRLLQAGQQHIDGLLAEGNTDEGFDVGFDLLGNVGFFMAACRRHEIDQVSASASALAMQLGASLGVIPRFASAHLETHNRALDGSYKSFTTLSDEKLFLEYNTRAVFAYIRASQALLQILPLGVSHPICADLLAVALDALKQVYESNQKLFEELDTPRFFYNVRPYYKPHKVGLHEYRGANAGDFAGINVIDLLLGLCRADDAYYSQLLVDKFLYMRPEDQLVLRDCMRRESLMDSFLNAAEDLRQRNSEWYQKHLGLFLEVCEAHGDTALQHHEKLVHKFIQMPAEDADLSEQTDLTASGPPLAVMLRALRKLCDLRSAADVEGIRSRYNDIRRLKDSLQK